ncbi:MAG TPA: hypothetical protein VED01_21585 [Burkholderiales bacterium]|nr:hypothetical protein [Burkholderiales bacterium]
MQLSARTLDGPEDIGALFSDMVARGYTDGLPVVPPTEAAVRAMIEGSGLDAAQSIAAIPPRGGAATVEKIAINAVMAGCLPEHLPVVIAAVRAIAEPAFNLAAVQATTSAATPVVIVNGPMRTRIGLNCGRGCLGPGVRANATIGRAVRLVMLNIGGGVTGDVDKSIHGMPGKYTFCFGELEEDSPWAPYHVERGYAAERSTVTVIAGQSTQSVYAAFRTPESIVHALADSMACYANGYLRGTGNPLVVLSPGHARIFAEHGWSKARLKETLFERTKIPLSYLPEEKQLSNPVYTDWDRSRTIQLCEQPDDITVIVAGGPEAYQITYIAAFSGSRRITAPIEAHEETAS